MKIINLKPFVQVMRLSQWVKNLIIFTPIFSLGIFEFNKILILSKIFIGFSLVVSSTYIINDLKDVLADMNHPIKSKRPIASKIFPLIYWKIFSFFLFSLGNTILYFIDINLLFFSFIYVVISIFYTFYFKYLIFADILTIPVLFTLRLFLGAITFRIGLSNYLLIFVISVSLGLASSKKYSILTDSDIKISRVKDHLIKNYSSKFLLNLTYISINTALITYLGWTINVKFNQIENIKFIFLIISCLLLFIFTNLFMRHTKLSKSEEFLILLVNNKKMLFVAIFFIIASAIGLT